MGNVVECGSSAVAVHADLRYKDDSALLDGGLRRGAGPRRRSLRKLEAVQGSADSSISKRPLRLRDGCFKFRISQLHVPEQFLMLLKHCMPWLEVREIQLMLRYRDCIHTL